MYAYGAQSVTCLDRFPIQKTSDLASATYARLVDSLTGRPRERAKAAFTVQGRTDTGLRSDAIRYRIDRDGLSRDRARYELIVSRAVLEHVNRLEATISDMAAALTSSGVAVHQVDLTSHGLDRTRTLDFLTWPEPLYTLMYGHKGYPNRWRLRNYRDFVQRAGLTVTTLVPTGTFDRAEIAAIRERMAAPFNQLDVDELAWSGFWMVLHHVR